MSEDVNQITDQVIDEAQVLTYLRFSRCRIGLLMNLPATMLLRGLNGFAL
jgi:hypothetical protein